MDEYRDRDARRGGDRRHQTDFDRWREASEERPRPEGPQWERPLDQRAYDRGPQYDQGGYRRGIGTGFDYEERYRPDRRQREGSDEGFEYDERYRSERGGRRGGSSRGRPEWGHEDRFERGRYAGTNTYDGGYGGQDAGSRGPAGEHRDHEDDYTSHGGYGRAPAQGPGFQGERVYGGNASGNLMRGPHSGRGPKGYQRSDDRILEDVSERLTHHGYLDASDITVTCENAEVTLEGTVSSREEKRLASELANTVSGVRDVHSRLRLKDRPAGQPDREPEPAPEARPASQPETSPDGKD